MNTATVTYDGQRFSLEYQWLNEAAATDKPLLLFLHEGLGCVRLWRDFPERLCQALDCQGLVFSRAGYGQSTALSPEIRWPVDYLQRQAEQALPAFLDALDLNKPDIWRRLWLIGHSDGGSIALLYGAAFPERLAGMAVMAPHIFVEDITITGIEQAKALYERDEQWRQRLGRYHSNPDSAFRGWNNAWLNPEFRAWNIEARLPLIRCPILAIQGEQDEYASLAQITGIQQHAPQTQWLALADCGHSPHLAQSAAVCSAIANTISQHCPP